MNESRRQFEGYWDDYTGSPDGRCKSLRSGTGYRNKAANECWEFWQASRQAIEISMPEPYDDGHGNLWIPQDGITGNIRAAGLKIKGE